MSILKKGSKGSDVKKLQEGLAFLGFHPGPIDGDFGNGTANALAEFQQKSRLIADGVAGTETLKAYEAALYKHAKGEYLFTLEPADPIKINNHEQRRYYGAPLETWVRCSADKFEDRGGYNRTTLRSDVAVAYKSLYEDVHKLGGIITSAGGKRSLSSKASPSRSKKSMHYVGRAFDMALPTGMQNPDKDPYVIVRESPDSRKWIVWCKSDSAENVDLEGTYVSSAKNSKGKRYTIIKTKSVSCRAFNLTALAESHGFHGISARRSFFNGGSYGGAEWWHFQYENGLVHGKTTFGDELLRVYPLDDAKKFVYWDDSKDCPWQVSWF